MKTEQSKRVGVVPAHDDGKVMWRGNGDCLIRWVLHSSRRYGNTKLIVYTMHWGGWGSREDAFTSLRGGLACKTIHYPGTTNSSILNNQFFFIFIVLFLFGVFFLNFSLFFSYVHIYVHVSLMFKNGSNFMFHFHFRYFHHFFFFLYKQGSNLVYLFIFREGGK